jgi:hypothetical protein
MIRWFHEQEYVVHESARYSTVPRVRIASHAVPSAGRNITRRAEERHKHLDGFLVEEPHVIGYLLRWGTPKIPGMRTMSPIESVNSSLSPLASVERREEVQ